MYGKNMYGKSTVTILIQWKTIKNCIPRKESTQQVYTKDMKEVANEFNQFFTSVGRRVQKIVHL